MAERSAPQLWHVPAPVEPGGLTPLRPGHAAWDVRVALGRIGAFGFGTSKLPDDELLWSELQLHPDDNGFGRLGAGRSGLYRGRYLKGVGRTALAANWNDLQDRYHGTGHLSVSSLLREALITRVLADRGLAHTIAGVDVVLARALSGAERADLASAGPLPSAAPADAHLAGITGKIGDFVRISNVVWLLSHVDPGPRGIAERFFAIERALTGEEGDGDPEVLAAALVEGWRRGNAAFDTWFRVGLYWQAFHDNFALDGRFLDLETPVYAGAPLLARVEVVEPTRSRAWMGSEVFHHARQWRVFVRWLAARCRFLARFVAVEPNTRSYLRAFADVVTTAFAETPLFDDGAMIRSVADRVASVLELGGEERALSDAIVAAEASRLLYARPRRLPALRMVPLPWQPAQSNPTVRQRLAAPDFVAARFRPSPDAAIYAEEIARLGDCADLDALLCGLAAALPPG